MAWDGLQLYEEVGNGVKCCEAVRDSVEYCPVAPNGMGSCGMAQYNYTSIIYGYTPWYGMGMNSTRCWVVEVDAA